MPNLIKIRSEISEMKQRTVQKVVSSSTQHAHEIGMDKGTQEYKLFLARNAPIPLHE